MTVGSQVRVLALPASTEAGVPADERSAVASMVGQVFEVYDLDEHGHAWVATWWDGGDGVCRSHSLGLDAEAMEIVSP